MRDAAYDLLTECELTHGLGLITEPFFQGAAQLLTVFASAVGPLLRAAGHDVHHSFVPTIRGLAIWSALFAVTAWWVPAPRLKGETHD